MYNPHRTILQRVFPCAVVDAIDLKKYIVVNGFVIAVCDQLQSLQQCPAHHGLDINEKNFAFRCKKLPTLLTLHSPLTLFTLFQQFWNKKAIVRICNVALLLYGLLSKKRNGRTDEWRGLCDTP